MNETKHQYLWDDCHSIEEQRARVFRTWLEDPNGIYNERWDNDKLVRLAIMFWVGPLLRRSGDESLEGYWCDGIVQLECPSPLFTDLQFSGVAVVVRRQEKWGLAPFELEIKYATELADIPTALNLRLGERDVSSPIFLNRYETADRGQAAMKIYSRRPTSDAEWAVNLTFAPYDAG